MIEIRKGLYADIYDHKSCGETNEQEKKAVAYLFKVRKDLFIKHHDSKYVLKAYKYTANYYKDYEVNLKFNLIDNS